MNIDALAKVCLALPGATENLAWGADRLFKIGGKMFACTGAHADASSFSLKTTPERYAALVKRPGVSPTGYGMYRSHWVTVSREAGLSQRELSELLEGSYGLVLEKLPKRVRESVGQPATSTPAPRRKAAVKRTPRKRTGR